MGVEERYTYFIKLFKQLMEKLNFSEIPTGFINGSFVFASPVIPRLVISGYIHAKPCSKKLDKKDVRDAVMSDLITPKIKYVPKLAHSIHQRHHSLTLSK